MIDSDGHSVEVDVDICPFTANPEQINEPVEMRKKGLLLKTTGHILKSL